MWNSLRQGSPASGNSWKMDTGVSMFCHNNWCAIKIAHQQNSTPVTHIWHSLVLINFRTSYTSYIIFNILINDILKTASETSRLTSSCNILFQIIAPLYLIPVLLRSSLTGGIWKWPAKLVSCWWISQFFTKKVKRIQGPALGVTKYQLTNQLCAHQHSVSRDCSNTPRVKQMTILSMVPMVSLSYNVSQKSWWFNWRRCRCGCYGIDFMMYCYNASLNGFIDVIVSVVAMVSPFRWMQ